MRPAAVVFRPSYLLSCASATKALAFASKALDPCSEGISFKFPIQSIAGFKNLASNDGSVEGKKFYTSASGASGASGPTGASGGGYVPYTSEDFPMDEDGMPPQRSYADSNLDARMRMKAYRREALQQRYASEMEIDRNKYDLDPAKLLQKGDPDTIQGVIKEIITQGYFVTLPEGKEGFLSSRELGCIGGIPLLSKLMKVGQEITCRAVRVGGYGRLVIAIKKDTPVDMPDRPYQGFRQGPGDRDLPSRRWRNNR